MDVVTIGEYADAKERQRDFICEQQVDLSLGEGASQKFNSRTSSIRVCANVAHRWRLGADAKATPESQRRPADVVESLDVTANEGWSMSFVVE
jgi:hypothetical protein